MLELIRKVPISPVRVDGASLRPSALLAMPLSELFAHLLPTNAGAVRLDEMFWVKCHSGNDDVVLVRGDCSRVDRIGFGMDGGTLIVVGEAGDYFGERQSDGILIATGSVGAYACRGLCEGTVYVGGNCGDRLAAPLPGERSGMRGGDIVIRGNVGDRACERMRRGTVVIAGSVGNLLATNMIAGTLLALGEVGDHWAGGMRRGSILFANAPSTPPAASWTPPRDLELSFLPLIWNHVRGLQGHLAELCSRVADFSLSTIPIPSTRWVERRIGDRHVAGRGEVLVLRRLTSAVSSDVSSDTTEEQQ